MFEFLLASAAVIHYTGKACKKMRKATTRTKRAIKKPDRSTTEWMW